MTYIVSKRYPGLGVAPLSDCVRRGQASIPRDGLGNFLSKLLSDPVSAILSAPATAIDAGAGGPQKRARTKAAIAAGTATQAQIDEERATRAAEIAAELARAQQDAAVVEAAARAKSKKTLTTTLAVGGVALLVVGGAFWLITGPKKKKPETQ